MDERFDVLVVGAGYAGSIMAERLAEVCGLTVLVIDRRDHIAGNAHDYVDEHGVLCHRYGPHIFHTNSQKIADYLSRFTEWRPYEHRVLSRVGDKLLPVPINRDTVNGLYDLNLSDELEMQRYLDSVAEPRERVENSEDAVVAKVGRHLYETFFRGYTRKQWALDPTELASSVTARIPLRLNTDDRYFTDSFQNIPADGYTAMFERILDHPNITVRVNTSFEDVRDEIEFGHLVYTGPIDAYYDHRFGKLHYRSLRFELETVATPGGTLAQPVAQLNEPLEDVAHTRTTEFRHITGQIHEYSTIAYEFPTAEGDPYYPIPRPQNRELYKRYEELAAAEADVTFVGRLARYQYLNMDQVVGQALSTFEKLSERFASSVTALAPRVPSMPEERAA